MKLVKVIWSENALIDLEIIYDFLSTKSQSAATNIVEHILNRAAQLENFPESGPFEPDLKDADKPYRYLVEGNYKIIYRYNKDNSVVYVVSIFDTRLDPEKLSVQ